MENTQKKLYRSQNDKIIFGVCGGLAKYFDIDPIIVRAAFLLLGLINGTGLVIYIVFAIIIQKEPADGTTIEEKNQTTEEKIKEAVHDFKKGAQDLAEKMKNKSWMGDKRNIIGLIIIAIGLVALINQFIPHWFSWTIFWSLALVFIGFYIIFKK